MLLPLFWFAFQTWTYQPQQLRRRTYSLLYSTDVWKYFNVVCEYEQQLHSVNMFLTHVHCMVYLCCICVTVKILTWGSYFLLHAAIVHCVLPVNTFQPTTKPNIDWSKYTPDWGLNGCGGSHPSSSLKTIHLHILTIEVLFIHTFICCVYNIKQSQVFCRSKINLKHSDVGHSGLIGSFKNNWKI